MQCSDSYRQLKQTLPQTLALFGLFVGLPTLTACNQSETIKQTAPQAVPVKVQILESAQVEDSSEFVGTLEAAQKVALKPEIQGKITEILVQAGDRVSVGTPILTLQPDQTLPQLESAKAALSAAQANRNTTQEQLRVAEKNLAVARTELASIQANRNLSKTNFDRARYLLNQGVIGKLDYDRAQNDLILANNRVRTAQDQVEAAQASVSQAQSVIHQAEAGIRQAQAQVATASVNVGFKQIVAPIAGTIGDISVQVGDVLSTGQSVANIVQNNALDLRLAVPSNRLNQLEIGLPVQLIDPTSKQQISTGSINFIAPTVDSTAQSVLVKARFTNPNQAVRNGQSVEARLIWQKGTGLLIPTSAVLQVSGKSFAYVAEPNDKGDTQPLARMRPVTLGEVQDQSYQVLKGLQPGESVIVSGILRLRDGVPIQPQ